MKILGLILYLVTGSRQGGIQKIGDYCVNGGIVRSHKCVDGLVCDLLPKKSYGTCKIPAALRCDTNADCASGSNCMNRICVHNQTELLTSRVKSESIIKDGPDWDFRPGTRKLNEKCYLHAIIRSRRCKTGLVCGVNAAERHGICRIPKGQKCSFLGECVFDSECANGTCIAKDFHFSFDEVIPTEG